MQAPQQKPVWKRGWFIAVAAILVLIVVGAATSNGSSSSRPSAGHPAAGHGAKHHGGDRTKQTTSGADEPSGENSGASGSPLNPDAGVPNTVAVGSTFVLGDFKVLKGWRVQNFGYGMGYGIKDLEVQNLTGDAHTFSAEIKLHQGSNRLVADMMCIADEAQPNEIVEVDCLPDGSGKHFDRVTIENAF